MIDRYRISSPLGFSRALAAVRVEGIFTLHRAVGLLGVRDIFTLHTVKLLRLTGSSTYRHFSFRVSVSDPQFNVAAYMKYV